MGLPPPAAVCPWGLDVPVITVPVRGPREPLRCRGVGSGQTPVPSRSPKRGAVLPATLTGAPPPARSPAAGAAVRASQRARSLHASAGAAERAAALRPPRRAAPAPAPAPRAPTPDPTLTPTSGPSVSSALTLGPSPARPRPSRPRLLIPKPPLYPGTEGPFRAGAGVPIGWVIWRGFDSTPSQENKRGTYHSAPPRTPT